MELPWATTPVHPDTEALLIRIGQKRSIKIEGQKMQLTTALIQQRLLLPSTGPLDPPLISTETCEAIFGSGTKGQYKLATLQGPHNDKSAALRFLIEALYLQAKPMQSPSKAWRNFHFPDRRPLR